MDLAMAATWSTEREEFAYFSKHYRQETVNYLLKRAMPIICI
ncbi:hypothetical protein C427_4847 [Paraglaciecola psychrophila 170]|uniref:Uncharacterized protein n=1 Tax=Paraglaciecola psychrophila 170 TaxID=1129794 RepID=K7AHA2_9ALTE|nr:hypothetical protein C427_4847 [Paraglaciecola psychrophila 170]GAC39978.1 hypothetical protein GPSY_4375 [Paraglaciecola psychrophila 170]